MKTGVDLLQTYMYNLFVLYSWDLLIINIIIHTDVTTNSENRVSESSENLIRTIPRSKDCWFFEKNESFQFELNVKNPCSKGDCKLEQKIICHR